MNLWYLSQNSNLQNQVIESSKYLELKLIDVLVLIIFAFFFNIIAIEYSSSSIYREWNLYTLQKACTWKAAGSLKCRKSDQ